MKAPWESAIENVTGLISEFVTDDDKRAELNVEIQRIDAGVRSQLLNTSTTPKVDAFVKLMIAFKDVIVPLFRPLGSACMTAFGMYCHLEGIDIDTGLHIMMDGAFPAWGASRHAEKQKKIKRKKRDDDYSDWDDDD